MLQWDIAKNIGDVFLRHSVYILLLLLKCTDLSDTITKTLQGHITQSDKCIQGVDISCDMDWWRCMYLCLCVCVCVHRRPTHSVLMLLAMVTLVVSSTTSVSQTSSLSRSLLTIKTCAFLACASLQCVTSRLMKNLGQSQSVCCDFYTLVFCTVIHISIFTMPSLSIPLSEHVIKPFCYVLAPPFSYKTLWHNGLNTLQIISETTAYMLFVLLLCLWVHLN